MFNYSSSGARPRAAIKRFVQLCGLSPKIVILSNFMCFALFALKDTYSHRKSQDGIFRVYFFDLEEISKEDGIFRFCFLDFEAL
jgi:hypothetical protein